MTESPSLRNLRSLPSLGIIGMIALWSTALLAEDGKPRPPIVGDQTGGATVKDGDSLIINGHEFRLYGIDTPEDGDHRCKDENGNKYQCKQQCKNSSGKLYPCGEEATKYLKKFIDNNPVVCKDTGILARGSHGKVRIVGKCSVAGEDLSRIMIKSGQAVTSFEGKKDYEKEQEAAQKARRGIWQSKDNPTPEQWRTDKSLRDRWGAPAIAQTPEHKEDDPSPDRSPPHSYSGSSSNFTSSNTTQHVRGYTRSDGTHVSGYERKAPSRYTSNNCLFLCN